MEVKTMEDDRLSELPEPILHKIMSFLELAEDAARLSVLSKSLYGARSSLPFLTFRFCYTRLINNGWRRITLEELAKRMNIVDTILANRLKHKITIQRFSIELPSYPYVHNWMSYFQTWIKTLIALHIKDLSLIKDFSLTEPKYAQLIYSTLPEEIFAAKELNVLHLRGFNLQLPHDGIIKFSSLRKLSLCDTLFDDHFIQALCESCSGLEDLSLHLFHGLGSFQLAAGTLPKLTRISLYGSEIQMVDIAAPNLEYLFISSCFPLQVIKITACKALRILHLKFVDVTEGWLEGIFSSLPNLESLSLDNCDALKAIKISSDQLKLLAVSRCENLIAFELDTPNLTTFSYTPSGDDLATLKLKASISLLKVELDLYSRILNRYWFDKLMKLLRNLNQSKAAIKLISGKELIIPKDMRKELLPPLYGARCWHITFPRSMNLNSVKDVLDSLLWISPQVETLSLVRTQRIYHHELIYEIAWNEDQTACYASLPLKRGRHELKEVKMENFTCAEQQELRNYLFKKCRYADD